MGEVRGARDGHGEGGREGGEVQLDVQPRLAEA